MAFWLSIHRFLIIPQAHYRLLTPPIMLRPSILAVYAYLILQSAHSALGTGHRWHFVQNGTSGVLALETIFISQTLALFFNSASQDPLMIDGHSAWGALWNIETNKPTAIRVRSDSFCASGAMLSNGTMVRQIRLGDTVWMLIIQYFFRLVWVGTRHMRTRNKFLTGGWRCGCSSLATILLE